LVSEALLGFVFLGLFSPGPNVILLTASGARFGFLASIPHLLGVVLGVGVIAGAVGFGVGTLVTTIPALQFGLQVLASLWILWMAWNMWNASPTKRSASDRPFAFAEAVLFQWVNPKIWAVAISATGYVLKEPAAVQSITLAAVFSGTNLFVCLFWTGAGTGLSRLLSSPFAWRVFMRTMALALAVFSMMVFL